MTWQQISTGNGTTPPRIARGGWLDALRFIVAFLIILHHFQLAAPIPLAEMHPAFERSGFLLTNFFLIDSGYVLARIYGERLAQGRMSTRQFYRQRFLRVVPAHLVMTAALVGIVVGGAALGFAPRNPEWFDWSQLPAQLLLVQSYGVPGGLGWNAPTWTLSALLGCYLAFPWIMRGLLKVSPWVVLGGGLAFFMACHALTWAVLDYPVYQMPLKHGIWRALPLFILGMVLARFAERVWISPRRAAWAGLAAAAGFFVLQYFGKFGLPSVALICVIILAAGAIPVRRPSALVEKAAMVSFAMFITNEVVRIGWFGVVNVLEAKLGLGVAVQWGLWGLGVAAAVVFAFVFYELFDRPSQKWLAGLRFSLPGRRAAAPAIPAE